MKKVLQNKNPQSKDPAEPGIKIVEGSNQWLNAYANYLRGQPPTESPLWKMGVYYTVEKSDESQYDHFSKHPALAYKPRKKEKKPFLNSNLWKVMAFLLAIVLIPIMLGASMFLSARELLMVGLMVIFFILGFFTRSYFNLK